MRNDIQPPGSQSVDPVRMARRDLQKALPRRFYRDVSVSARNGGFGLDLDEKPVRTPAKAPLVVPTRALADLLAEEWRAQEEWIDPDDMPVTCLVNTGLDGVSKTLGATAIEISNYAATDLVCYRAGQPESLVVAQSEAWDPVLAFAWDKLGARFACAEGMMFIEQPKAALAAVRTAVDVTAVASAGALKLAALSVMTNLTGSVLLGLAVTGGAFTAEAAWTAANVDEDWQWQHWGDDAEARRRRALRWRDMQTAAKVYALAG